MGGKGRVEEQVYEWVEYHRVALGVTHFYLYDSGAIDDVMRKRLERHIEGGVVTITDLRAIMLFDVFYGGQVSDHVCMSVWRNESGEGHCNVECCR